MVVFNDGFSSEEFIRGLYKNNYASLKRGSHLYCLIVKFLWKFQLITSFFTNLTLESELRRMIKKGSNHKLLDSRSPTVRPF